MTGSGTLDEAIAERRQVATELEQNAERARVLNATVEDKKVDLQRAEARHVAFAEVGSGHVEIPMKQYVPKYHSEIEFQPLLSLLSGNELAAKVQEKIEYLKARIPKPSRRSGGC